MGIVVSLTGFAPPPRYDLVPFDHVEVEEAVAPDGPWTLIDTQALSPLDIDPSLPRAQNVTTTHATLDAGWYRLKFTDSGGSRSEPSDPVRNSVDDELLPPTPDAVRNASPLLRKKFPVPATDPFAPADLRRIVYQSIGEVEALTWRIIDRTLGDPAPVDYRGDPVPPALAPSAIEAVTRMSERLYITMEPQFAEQIATGRRLRGFSAGPYSEQYFAPGEFARRGVVGRPRMDSDDQLDAILWALATEDARDYFIWREAGLAPPTGVVTPFDYRRQSIGYQAGAAGGEFAGGMGRGGPDGF